MLFFDIRIEPNHEGRGIFSLNMRGIPDCDVVDNAFDDEAPPEIQQRQAQDNKHPFLHFLPPETPRPEYND